MASLDKRGEEALSESLVRAVRDEMRRAAWGESCLPLNVDTDAELLLIGAALHGHVEQGVEQGDFFSRVHQELWDCATRDNADWPELKGNGDAVAELRHVLESHTFTTKLERQEAAERVSELAARRKLRALFKQLEAEMAHDMIDCGDAERELERYLAKP